MWSKKSLCAIALLLILSLSAGCNNREKYGKFTEEQMQQIGLANKYNLPEPSGSSMVLGVQSETVTSDEILADGEDILKSAATRMNQSAFANQALPYIRSMIREKVAGILLYEQARRNAPETIDDMLEKAVESEVNRFVASYGNDYTLAEKKFKEYQMGTDWRSFREYQKRLIMTQSYLSSQFKTEKRFSQRLLVDYYEENKDEIFCRKGKISFSLISIWPERLSAEQIADDPTAEAAAKRIADEVLKQLADGADFAEIAKQYHGDLAAAGGKILEYEPGASSMGEPYNSLEAVAIEMEPGQLKGLDIDGHVFVLKLDTLQKAECKSFEEIKHLIAQHLLDQYNRKQHAELIEKLVSNTDIAGMEGFAEFCVNQAYKRWGQSG